MSKYSCVASFHTNPFTCGVARFNVSLAKSLKTKVLPLSTARTSGSGKVLLSIKLQEIDEPGKEVLRSMIADTDFKFDVFLHACEFSSLEDQLLQKAESVFVASSEIGKELHSKRPDVVSLFAPGAAVTANTKESQINLLTFGMAHKISAAGYRRLGKLLSEGSQSFSLEVSSALHEGTSFDENFFLVGSEISEVFGGNVVFLGFLADDEVSRRLLTTTALVAFFPKGVRENNTTVMSAMAHGCAVISNLDPASPTWMQHGYTIFDVNQLTEFPDSSQIKQVGQNAQQAVGAFSFVELAKLLQKE